MTIEGSPVLGLANQWIKQAGYWQDRPIGRGEYGRIARGIKALLADGYADEDILDCLNWAKGWAKAQLWPQNIHNQIAKWIADGRDGSQRNNRRRYIEGEYSEFIRH